MSGRDRSGCLSTALLVIASALVFAAGAIALYLVMNAPAPQAETEHEASLEPKAFAEYTWDELSQVSDLIASEPTVEEAEEVARDWGIEVGDTRPLPLADGRQASLTVVGICHDERADGSGLAGLTLMTSPIALMPMESSATIDGGWEGSALRSWLEDEGGELLPSDLLSLVVSVSKLSNNVGVTSDTASVTETSDRLWLFSVAEVCGPVDIYATEYGDEVQYRTGYLDYALYDAVLSAEGTQYAYFESLGVDCHGDPQGTLELKYAGASTGWWYRSSHILSVVGKPNVLFFQVMDSGYPISLGSVEQPSGVVVGLCL